MDRRVGVLFWVSFWYSCIYTSGGIRATLVLIWEGMSWNAE